MCLITARICILPESRMHSTCEDAACRVAREDAAWRLARVLIGDTYDNLPHVCAYVRTRAHPHLAHKSKQPYITFVCTEAVTWHSFACTAVGAIQPKPTCPILCSLFFIHACTKHRAQNIGTVMVTVTTSLSKQQCNRPMCRIL